LIEKPAIRIQVTANERHIALHKTLLGIANDLKPDA